MKKVYFVLMSIALLIAISSCSADSSLFAKEEPPIATIKFNSGNINIYSVHLCNIGSDSYSLFLAQQKGTPSNWSRSTGIVLEIPQELMGKESVLGKDSFSGEAQDLYVMKVSSGIIEELHYSDFLEGMNLSVALSQDKNGKTIVGLTFNGKTKNGKTTSVKLKTTATSETSSESGAPWWKEWM